MQNVFFEALQVYYGPILAVILFMIMVIRDRLFERHTKHLFLVTASVVLVLMIASWADRCLSTIHTGDWAWRLRALTTCINFGLSPVSPLLLNLIYTQGDTHRKKMLFFLPAILSGMICIMSMKMGWIFAVSMENVYTRGHCF